MGTHRRLGDPAAILRISQRLVHAGQHEEEDSRQEDQDGRQGQGGLEASHDQHEQQRGHHSRRQLHKGVPL